MTMLDAMKLPIYKLCYSIHNGTVKISLNLEKKTKTVNIQNEEKKNRSFYCYRSLNAQYTNLLSFDTQTFALRHKLVYHICRATEALECVMISMRNTIDF